MAKEKQDTSQIQTNSFIKGLNKDSDPMFVQEGMWTHARNAVNNTAEGDLGTLSNEESNALCARAGQTMGSSFVYIIGAIHLFSDKWIIYSVGYDALNTKANNSEIGLFESDVCKYRPIVQDHCLNFSKLHLITGASKLKDDCTWQVYWADNLNPDRFLNVGDPQTWPPDDYSWLGGGPNSNNVNYYGNGSGTRILWPNVAWKEKCETDPGGLDPACKICRPVNKLNCDAIRLASLVKTPCLDLKLSNQAGVIENGAYAITTAYTINRQRVTNYFSAGYTQPVFNVINERGSFEITVDADSEHFEEFELVVVRFIDQNLSAKRIGYYSTRLKTILLDQIPETTATVPVEDLILQNPVFEKSAQMTEVNNYLLRIGPTSKFDFNYQPLANLIQAEWVSIEYPETYYVDGGKHTSYLRDEVYSFFIRWVYNTGDKSASYHIPGRPPANYNYNGTTYFETDPFTNQPGTTLPNDNYFFQSINTASILQANMNDPLPDGGVIISRGKMGYWESTEIYPDFQPDVWNSSSQCWTRTTDPDYDLCGKPIRHHKFPDNALHPSTHHFRKKLFSTAGTEAGYKIRLMGVQFKNIIFPKDNDGNDITNIVGYEILRGSRHGSRSILAKGMINNFRDYNPRGGAADDGVTGLYANYPFNTIIPRQNNLNFPAFGNYKFNDPFITKRDNDNDKENQVIPRDIISFHSPDTSFINPYLSTTELKIYGSVQGQANQYFIEPSKHPMFKLLANAVIPFAMATGVLNALLKGLGEVKINYPAGNYTAPYFPLMANGSTIPPAPVPPGPTPTAGGNVDVTGTAAVAATANTADAALQTYLTAGGLITEAFNTGPGLETIFNASADGFRQGGSYIMPTYEKVYGGYQMLGAFGTFLNGLTAFGGLFYYFIEGMQLAVDTIYAVVRKRQYALELIGHGDYSRFVAPNQLFDRRYVMEEGQYVFDQVQALPEFTDSSGVNKKYRINNIKRPKLVVIRTKRGDTLGTTDGPHYLLQGNSVDSDPGIDQSLMTLGHAIRSFNGAAMIPGGSAFTPNKVNWNDRGKINNFLNPIASHYVGLKYNIENQYGQIDTIQQVVATPCEQKIDFDATQGDNVLTDTIFGNFCNIQNFTHRKFYTPVFFGGDTYINRFTEKSIMPFFYDWLYDVPDNFEWNYFLNQMIPEPKFQANTQPWDISDFNLNNILTNVFTSNPDYGEGALPTSYYDLDNIYFNLQTNLSIGYPGFLRVKNSYFYTAACGIRDFFVESEVLVDFRDPGTFPWEQPYNKYNYTDLESLFDSNPQILAKGNYYAYDYTLSAIRFLFNQYFTAGYLQGSTYDPNVAELCYVSYPNRITYSLQQQEQSNVDAWITFLPLNRVDYKSKLSSVKNFAKTGMFITFENDSPLIHQGVDTLQLDDSGTKVTVGDGGLFSQVPQNVVVAEKPYEYGSSQNKYAVVSTPAGLYYISQNQGKVFSYSEGLQEISQDGMKWWFSEFLPYKLLEDFPNYPHTDNPVAGIACMASYDNDNSVLFFSKRDFKLKADYQGQVTYDPERDNFQVQRGVGINGAPLKPLTFKLGDPLYFEDASWTVSYDPKLKFWISFHDWHPNFYIPSKGTFLTTKVDGIWKHSAFCNDYCNFYGVQYPFEVELPVITGQMVNTVKSIEYYLECYRRERNLCVDQFHVLDYNFDQAVIFNSEQVSGYLNLNLYPKNDIPLSLQFPRLATNQASYDILYAKEEHKYRINQFWDITRDRGEFPIGSDYPPSPGPYYPDPNSTVLLGNYEDRNIWITQPNGYIKALNLPNLNYEKPQLERKKFRHYINFIKLSKSNSRDTNMILKIINTKTQYSPR
jgi:hypothetical protein